ncbi:SusC/RagA family TonB-linked outer membrane protein [Urechidicola vernalis]|uniref:TonB-dependent receptor n=1 Tax=Urechidicola vernalis TaxID=3075600 RepID=A0ABU2Y6K3_9FLAO|nr:TonB-dependent receptor [Urechidicola sp. P050]MDT0552688.1 TonB-dependent receptor [Urechidicola sp. P050]
MKKNLNKIFLSWNANRKKASKLELSFYCMMIALLSVSKVQASAESNSTTSESTSTIQQTITGTVTDEEGNPLPGVGIFKKGTTDGVESDFDGNFSIQASSGDVLVFSFIGMTSVEMTITSQTVLNVTMAADSAELEEVVIVGYGAKLKTDLTGAVGTVKSESLVQAPTSTATELLSGRVSGLITKQNTGVPGNDATTINIRGFGAALVLVDGVQTSMDRIDPNDIESVSVLKDGAAAVYGSRAGNGVVLVTTKRGKEGKTKITYHGNSSFQSPVKERTYVNSWQYATLIREADLNGNSSIDDTYTEEDVDKFRAGNDPAYPNQDWNDAVFTENVPMTQHNLNVSGGSENVKYFASIGLLDQESAYRSGDLSFQRYNLRSNLDAKISKKLSFGVDLSYRREDRDQPATNPSDMYNRLQTAQPIYPAFLPDPTRAAFSGFNTRSPYAATDKSFGGYNDDLREFINARVQLKFNITDDLVAKGVIMYESLNTSRKALRKPYDVWEYDYENDEYLYSGTAQGRSSITEDYRKRIQFYPQFSLQYKKNFNGHNINALGLVETIEIRDDAIQARRFDLISTDIPYLSSGDKETAENSGNASSSGRMSYVGRVNYDYKGKYFLEATMRADATGEKFHPDNRWGYFPSVSGAWRLSQENFLVDSESVDNLKLRASYSQTGLDNVGNYRFLTGYSISANGTYLIDDRTGQIIFTNGLPNEEVTWFTNTLYNVGVDGSFWNGLFGFEVDVFYRLTEGLFGTNQTDIPSTFGATLPQENINDRDDRGFDILLTHRNTIGDDFSYSVSANVGWARQKWVSVAEEAETDPDRIRLYQREGNYTNRWLGFVSDGLFETQEEIDNHATYELGNAQPVISDIKYVDLNGDGVIDWRDQKDIGTGSTPDISYGLDIFMKYKNFSVAALFQGAGLFNMNIAGAARGGFSNQSTPYDYMLKYSWRPDYNDPTVNTNPMARLPRITHNGVAPNNNVTSDFWLLDNTYVRLKSLNLNYAIDSDIVSKIGFDGIDIYAAGTNLFSFNSLGIYKDTFDPESPASQNGRHYPIMKTFTLGVKLAL